jgi:CHRD domain
MRTRHSGTTAAAIAALTLGYVATAAVAVADDDRDRRVAANLSGYNEVHFSAGPPAALRGAISTKATGKFSARIDGDVIHYTLSYKDLEGAVTQAHIHFGQRHSVGGIVVWLCETDGTPAPVAVQALTPACPQEGTVKGTITAEQVLAVANQGIEAGQYDELVKAIRAGATYANVHSSLWLPGEVRGQVRDRKRGGHNHH